MKVKLILRDGREVGEFTVDGAYTRTAEAVRRNRTYFFQTMTNQHLWPYQEGTVWVII